MPQEIAIYPDLTAKENLRFFGKLYDLSGQELDRILETIGLTDRANERTEVDWGNLLTTALVVLLLALATVLLQRSIFRHAG